MLANIRKVRGMKKKWNFKIETNKKTDHFNHIISLSYWISDYFYDLVRRHHHHHRRLKKKDNFVLSLVGFLKKNSYLINKKSENWLIFSGKKWFFLIYQKLWHSPSTLNHQSQSNNKETTTTHITNKHRKIKIDWLIYNWEIYWGRETKTWSNDRTIDDEQEKKGWNLIEWPFEDKMMQKKKLTNYFLKRCVFIHHNNNNQKKEKSRGWTATKNYLIISRLFDINQKQRQKRKEKNTRQSPTLINDDMVDDDDNDSSGKKMTWLLNMTPPQHKNTTTKTTREILWW